MNEQVTTQSYFIIAIYRRERVNRFLQVCMYVRELIELTSFENGR